MMFIVFELFLDMSNWALLHMWPRVFRERHVFAESDIRLCVESPRDGLGVFYANN